MINYLMLGVTFAFAAGVQPGPLQTYIISQTIKRGWRATLPASFAPVLSDGPILVLVLFLLSTVPDTFIIFLRLAGGLFLLFLSYNAFKTWRRYNPDEQRIEEPEAKTLMSAVVVNLLNPNPYIGWSLVMGPLFMKGWGEAPANGISLIVGFYSTIVITLAGTIILFGFTQKLGPKVSRGMIGLSSLALFAFALYQLWSGVIYFQN
jgi:threonine/homoserine/homoserine lactone efflux protein